MSLYRLDPSDGTLRFVAGNNHTLNPTPGTDGIPYLLFDSVLYVGLTAGDYYLAVSDGWNTPSPGEGTLPGSEGLFDPNRSHSGQYGSGTGSYVLNVQARLDSEAPQVVSASPARGATLDQPPTYLVVQFSEEVTIRNLASKGAPGPRRGDLHQGSGRGQVFPPAHLVRPGDPHGDIPDAGWTGEWGI